MMAKLMSEAKMAISVLRLVLTNKKYALIALLSAPGIALVFGSLSGLVPNPFFQVNRMMPPTFPDYAFLGIISIISGLLAALIMFKSTESKIESHKEEATGILGAIFGYIAVLCLYCNVLLFSLLGVSFSFAFLFPYLNEIRALSVVLLLVALYWAIKGIGKKCIQCD